MKKIFYLAFVVFCGVSYAQQEQQFTQYMINPYTINPALGGTEDFIDVKLGYRKQWVGLESSPRTFYLTGHGTIGKEFNGRGYHHKTEHKKWHGIGGYVYGDKTGPISRTSFYGQYAYNIGITRKVRLSLGTFFGFKQFSYDVSGLRRETQDDVVLPDKKMTKVIPDVNLGFWAYSEYWFFGASAFQLLQNDITFEELTASSTTGTENNGQLVSHYFITGGLRMPMSKELAVIPSFAVKGVSPAPVSVDLNVKVDYNDQYFGGFSYRVGDSFSGIIGTVINKMWEVSYSYDLTTSDLRKVSAGSHEIIVGVRIKHPGHVICASQFW